MGSTLYLGSAKVGSLYLGSAKVAEMYKGSTKIFSAGEPSTGTVTIGSNTYHYITIGSTRWLVENFKERVGTYVYANGQSSNYSTHGFIYRLNTITTGNGDTLSAITGISNGWALPTTEQLTELASYNTRQVGEIFSAGTNSTGFTGLCSGIYDGSSYMDFGSTGNLASCNEASTGYISCLALKSFQYQTAFYSQVNTRYVSVRLCKAV